jgi:hypothetical protein
MVGLILLAVHELERFRVDASEICTDAPALSAWLRTLGFVGVRVLNLLYRAAGKSPMVRKEYCERSQWKLRPADGDNFFT